MAANKRKPWINAEQPLPCAHAFKAPDKDGKVRFRDDDSFRCRYPLPEITYPNAISRSYGFHKPEDQQRTAWAFKSVCAGCPCYTPALDPSIPEWQQFEYHSDAPYKDAGWYDFPNEQAYLWMRAERHTPIRRKPLTIR